MIGFIAVRCASALVVVAGVVCIVFALLHVVPGDPVDAMLGESAFAADREALRRQLGLDRPITTQLINYLARITRGDLGTSLYTQRPVADLLRERLSYTAALAATALLLAIVVAVPLGVAAALRHNRWLDRVTMTLAVVGTAIPNFWLGPVLILVFALWAGWLPVSGAERWQSIVLPALTLGTALMAVIARMTRSAMLEVLREDFLRTAYAKGLAPSTVILRHAMPNAAIPVVTVLGLQLGALLGGAVITETIFAWPGLGQLTVESIQRRDYPVVQGCVLLISVVYVTLNLAIDLAYARLDPRIRWRSAS